jgi:two-component system LytT family sensor kinase
MRILKFIFLWLGLTLCFILFNSSFQKFAILAQAINSLLFTIGYYFSYYILIKKLLYKNRFVPFSLLYLLVIIVLSTISFLSGYGIFLLQKQKFFVDNYFKDPVFFTSNFALVLFVTSSLLSFRFFRDKIRTQILLENLEKEKISTELSFLKAQINPHFLFNSLNNILFQIDKSNKDARETLLKFSEMLRYQLYDCSTDQIEIEKELQYIRNYVEIQMLRRTERYDCKLTISDSVKKFRIAPLLLIPFIENAFKYVSNHAVQKNSIDISIDCKDKYLVFQVANHKDQFVSVGVDENKGIGLTNVKRRLDLLYPEKYKLEITDGENQFNVELKIKVE